MSSPALVRLPHHHMQAAESKFLIVSRRAEQHLSVARALSEAKHQLKMSAQRSTAYSKTLGDVTQRLLQLRARVADDGAGQKKAGSAEEDILVEIGDDPAVVEAALLGECPNCLKRFLPGFLQPHLRHCHASLTGIRDSDNIAVEADPDAVTRRCSVCGALVPTETHGEHENGCRLQRTLLSRAQEALYSLHTDVDVSLPPGPPTDVRAEPTSYNSITVRWADPVFSGGQPIFEHEIAYELYANRAKNRDTNRFVTTCSRWCLDYPVALESFVLSGLPPATEVLNIRVRCKNKVGSSEWSTSSAQTKSMQSIASTPPLFLKCVGVTSSSFTLEWDPPLFDGGNPVLDYELLYSFEVRDFETDIGHVKKPSKPMRSTVSCGNVCKYTLSGLPPSTDYTAIAVRAKTAYGRSVLSTQLDVIRTQDADMKGKILQELERVRASDASMIDTNFIQGVFQRIGRLPYIAYLEDRLKELSEESTTASPQAKPAAPSRPGSSTTAGDETDAPGLLSDKQHEQRCAHFVFKINKMKAEVDKLQEELLEIHQRRAAIRLELVELEVRRHTLDGEIQRVAEFQGKRIDSRVVHGHNQRYDKPVLLETLKAELEDNVEHEARLKMTLVRDAKRRAGIRDRILLLNDAQITKQRQLDSIVAERQKLEAAKSTVLKWRQFRVYKMFSRWRRYISLLHNRRGVAKRVLLRFQSSQVARAFDKWKQQVELFKATAEVLTKPAADVTGVGSVMLAEVSVSRTKASDDVAYVLQQLRRVDLALDDIGKPAVERSRADVGLRKAKRLLPKREEVDPVSTESEEAQRERLTDVNRAQTLLAAGRSALKVNQLRTALHTVHEAEVLYGKHMDASGLLECYSVSSECLELQQEWATAAVHRSRHLMLAKQVDNKLEQARALHGMGKAAIQQAHYREAMDHFEQALSFWELLQQDSLAAECLRALQRVFQELDLPDKAADMGKKAVELEDKTYARVEAGFGTLQTLQKRLLGSALTAVSAYELEDVSVVTAALRKVTNFYDTLITAETELIRKSENTVTELTPLLVIMEQEYEATGYTAETRLASQVLNQVVLIKDLRHMLKKLMPETRTKIRLAEQAAASARIRLSNHEDQKKFHVAHIETEEGDLAKRVREAAVYRCIGFNEANVRLNTVMGSATGTVNACFVSKGASLTAFRLSDGVCLASSSLLRTASDLDPGFHTKPITCVSYNGDLVVSGSMDCTARVWSATDFIEDVVTEAQLEERLEPGVFLKPPSPPKCKLVFDGHTRAVTALKLCKDYVISGSADLTMMFWCFKTGALFRQVKGFDSSVISLSVFRDTTIACGCADGVSRLWTVAASSKNPVARLRPVYSFQSGDGGICSVSHNFTEVVCGHRSGTVSVWSASTGDVVFVAKPHTLAVSCIQSDNQKIVTGSFDGFVKVLDLATGECVQSLPIEIPVVGLQFDSARLLAVTQTGRAHVMEWEDGFSENRSKVHVVQKHESAARVARAYGVTVSQLMEWNGIRDPNGFYAGQTLIVKPAVKSPAKVAA